MSAGRAAVGMFEGGAQRLRPRVVVEIVEQRAARDAGLGRGRSRQAMDEPCIERPGDDLAALGALARGRRLVEQAAQFRRGVVRREKEPARAAHRLGEIRRRRLDARRVPPILPGQDRRERPAAVALPQQTGRALHSQADRAERTGPARQLVERRLDAVGDFLRLVLDVLAVANHADLAPRLRQHPAVLVEDRGLGRARALVDGGDALTLHTELEPWSTAAIR